VFHSKDYFEKECSQPRVQPGSHEVKVRDCTTSVVKFRNSCLAACWCPECEDLGSEQVPAACCPHQGLRKARPDRVILCSAQDHGVPSLPCTILAATGRSQEELFASKRWPCRPQTAAGGLIPTIFRSYRVTSTTRYKFQATSCRC